MADHSKDEERRQAIANRWRGEMAALEFPTGPLGEDGKPTLQRVFSWLADVPLNAVVQFLGSHGQFARNAKPCALRVISELAYALPQGYMLRDELCYQYEQHHEGLIDAELIEQALPKSGKKGERPTLSYDAAQKLGLSPSRMKRAGWKEMTDHAGYEKL